jgi:uncharacterized protein (DUF952 family)
MQNLIVHLCRLSDWEQALRQGAYRSPSLDTEGFIHLSRPEQILWVANQFYQHQQDLVLLWVDPEKLQAKLQWDAVEQTTFPHLYGELNPDAVVKISSFSSDFDGVFRNI